MFLASLLDPAIGISYWLARPTPALGYADPGETQAVADCFISARTRTDPPVALAYRQRTSLGFQYDWSS